jgi:hypothetical protein
VKDKAARSWLLVYLADPDKPGEEWFDRGNDPEMRAWPMTWGICRTDTRIDARIGDDLYFVAFGANRPPEERYYLTARFLVGEKISWPEAVDRFHGRPNVLIDSLPLGPSVPERVVEYIAAHREELRWDGRRRVVLASLEDGGAWLHEHAEDFVIEIDGRDFVHAYHDDHADWRSRRVDGPYLVAADTVSKVLATPIRYTDLGGQCPSLPPADRLRTTGRQPRHNRRLLADDAAACLRQLFERSPGRRGTGGKAASKENLLRRGHETAVAPVAPQVKSALHTRHVGTTTPTRGASALGRSKASRLPVPAASRRMRRVPPSR